MNLKQFIEKYDFENSVVLLEGKREVLEDDKAKLVELGLLLAKNSKHILFRSGNANGADYFFSLGVAKVDKNRLQVITPYKGHNKSSNLASSTVSLDQIDLSKENDIVEQSKLNKKTKDLVEKYVNGEQNRLTIKATYIIRDTVKVLGTNNIPAATFAFFYDDLSNPMQGGTGHTINICNLNNVPHLNQTIWFDWLD